jgi:hypothetical protein
MDLVSNEEKNFLYHVLIYVHEVVDVKYEIWRLNGIQVFVNVDEVNDFLQVFFQIHVDELNFEFHTKKISIKDLFFNLNLFFTIFQSAANAEVCNSVVLVNRSCKSRYLFK